MGVRVIGVMGVIGVIGVELDDPEVARTAPEVTFDAISAFSLSDPAFIRWQARAKAAALFSREFKGIQIVRPYAMPLASLRLRPILNVESES